MTNLPIDEKKEDTKQSFDYGDNANNNMIIQKNIKMDEQQGTQKRCCIKRKKSTNSKRRLQHNDLEKTRKDTCSPKKRKNPKS